MKSGLVILGLLGSFAASACSSASNVPAQTETPIPTIAVEKHTLANGLDVLLVEDHRLPRVAVNLWYHVGPVNEEPGRTGFAHLFEHMMFQKSKHIPEYSGRQLLQVSRGGRRERDQRHDGARPHELLRDRSQRPARAGIVAGIRSHGLSARRPYRRIIQEPAGCCAQRAPPGH